MNDYAKEEAERVINNAMAEEERDLRAFMASPWTLDHERREPRVRFIERMREWRLARGDTPEAFAAWEKDFRHSLQVDTLEARFTDLLRCDPDRALRL